MRLQNNQIVMDKEEFLTNSLLAGIACQLLAQTSQLEINEWMQYLSDKADEQYKQMSPKQREDMINAYLQISQQ
ncbi:hypothetical protein NIES4075_25210 [Tolypothrix sp. NIES-4075]|uniref:hypothetical protein n=1 Tax=Tolypothrix sp. NIES-4075 TaxID=2005459 RepID=UPI000B5CA52D|nr:hypothetical protein [Tolypothrix sp. NIES-4075]GAX41548.1 hypothetical protein NIES4075_25210 [Tolypothrix sp. NIES-4075]